MAFRPAFRGNVGDVRVVSLGNVCAYKRAYTLVSVGCISLLPTVATKWPSCSILPSRAARFRSFGRTFNPKVAGSIPARPIRMVAPFLVALAVAPWSHPLGFAHIAGWTSGQSGNTQSVYRGRNKRSGTARVGRVDGEGRSLSGRSDVGSSEQDAPASVAARRDRLGGHLFPRGRAETRPALARRRQAVRVLRGGGTSRRRVRADRFRPRSSVLRDRPHPLRRAPDERDASAGSASAERPSVAFAEVTLADPGAGRSC